jgi:hypothetical protein
MNTQKIMRLADIYAERCNDHQRHATEETHHDMMLFRKALEAEANRLHSINAELLESLKLLHLHLTTPIALQVSRADLVKKASAAIAKAQE